MADDVLELALVGGVGGEEGDGLAKAGEGLKRVINNWIASFRVLIFSR